MKETVTYRCGRPNREVRKHRFDPLCQLGRHLVDSTPSVMLEPSSSAAVFLEVAHHLGAGVRA